MKKLVQTVPTTNTLRIRSLPAERPDTDTGARLQATHVAESLGASHDKQWEYVVAPAGAGWVSAAHLRQAAAPAAPAAPTAAVSIPATARFPRAPHGIDALRATFGDPRPFIRTAAVLGPDGKVLHAAGTVRPEWEKQFISGRVDLPAPVTISWEPQKTTQRIGCHVLMVDVFTSVFNEIHRRGLWAELRSYGGCFNWRNARGLSKLSTHCWGISVDLDCIGNRNGLGVEPTIDQRIVAIFRDHGFVWGGDWTRKDGMHFQFVSGY
jgi:hypothetical protein